VAPEAVQIGAGGAVADVAVGSDEVVRRLLHTQPRERPPVDVMEGTGRGQGLAQPAHLPIPGDARVGQPVAGPWPSPWRRSAVLDGRAAPVADTELGDGANAVRQRAVDAHRQWQQPRDQPGADGAEERVGGGGDREGAVGEPHHKAADLVLVVVGVRPDTALAVAAGVATGVRGALRVDRRMRTNLPDVLAAGDCVETWHRLLDRPACLPLGTTATSRAASPARPP